YSYGYLVAVSSADIYEGTSDLSNLTVDDFRDVTKEFLSELVRLTIASAGRSKVKNMREMTTADIGRISTYFEDQSFDLFGSLDDFPRLPLPPSEDPATKT